MLKQNVIYTNISVETVQRRFVNFNMCKFPLNLKENKPQKQINKRMSGEWGEVQRKQERQDFDTVAVAR